MPPSCKVCMHPQRGEIDAALIQGTPIRIIADRFDLSLGSINRHRAKDLAHLEVAARAVVARKEDQYRQATAEVASSEVRGATAREQFAMSLLPRLEKLVARGETVLDALDPDILDPEQVEAFSKLLASCASVVSSAVSALGGGAGRHAEHRARLTGELKPASTSVTVQVAVATLRDEKTGRFAPELQGPIDAEIRGRLEAAINAMAASVEPVTSRQAARALAWEAAAAWEPQKTAKVTR